jgi:Protein of unknown function (DUF3224)
VDCVSAGSFTAPFKILHLSPCPAPDQRPAPAQETFRAEGTFIGAVEGTSGSFDVVFVGTIDSENHARGTMEILRGTGGLAHLQGAIQLAGIEAVGGAYTGSVELRS